MTEQLFSINFLFPFSGVWLTVISSILNEQNISLLGNVIDLKNSDLKAYSIPGSRQVWLPTDHREH